MVCVPLLPLIIARNGGTQEGRHSGRHWLADRGRGRGREGRRAREGGQTDVSISAPGLMRLIHPPRHRQRQREMEARTISTIGCSLSSLRHPDASVVFFFFPCWGEQHTQAHYRSKHLYPHPSRPGRHWETGSFIKPLNLLQVNHTCCVHMCPPGLLHTVCSVSTETMRTQQQTNLYQKDFSII